MFSRKVCEQLQYYVYLYVDPRDSRTFYIGKGRGNRAFTHLNDRSESEKVRYIDELREAGFQPQVDILRWGMTEREALAVEATAIDLLDIGQLTNCVRGHGTRDAGRASYDQVATQLDADPVDVDVPAVLIVINQAFRFGMSQLELYDATRSAWVIGERRTAVRYAMAVFRGVVREVYVVEAWLRGGATMRGDDQPGQRRDMSDRWEFVGHIAPEPIRGRFKGGSVQRYFKRGAANPIRYVHTD